MEDRSRAGVVRLAWDEGVEIVDFRFCDLPCLMQHFSARVHMLGTCSPRTATASTAPRSETSMIQESDMILVPDPNTAVLDPFRQHKTLNLNCFVKDPLTGEPYSRDPRYVAKKSETT